MLLTISTEHEPATDLGYLLHKHPDRLQTFDLSFGKAHVYYPEAGQDRCVACLLLDVDPGGMVRGKNRNKSFLLGHYVNDRPYVASSFMSVAISQVFGTAMGARCKDRPELVSTPMPLVARIDILPVRGGEGWRTPLLLSARYPNRILSLRMVGKSFYLSSRSFPTRILCSSPQLQMGLRLARVERCMG
ncbi:MAG: hypothetical protein WKF77_10325 [Planctomycetaceae bacterium]